MSQNPQYYAISLFLACNGNEAAAINVPARCVQIGRNGMDGGIWFNGALPLQRSLKFLFIKRRSNPEKIPS